MLVDAGSPDGLSLALRDAGYEVIDVGSGQTAAAVAAAAVDEDVDAVVAGSPERAVEIRGRLRTEGVATAVVVAGSPSEALEALDEVLRPAGGVSTCS